jgi:ABC-type ATPase involved in cell division
VESQYELDKKVSFYRRQLGTAFQDFNIYAASLAENVCMGEEADGDRLQRNQWKILCTWRMRD